MSLNIEIKTIPHSAHRYDTCGDYYQIGRLGLKKIRVSDLNNWRHEMLIAIHELIEMATSINHGVTPKDIDDWDMNFKGDGEPGNDPNCPYFTDHQFATNIERQVAAALEVNWDEYEKAINDLVY